MMAEDLPDDLELQNSDDEGQVPASHSKLLGAVSQLYEKKRVKAPTRKEPSLEVSEFHLSQPNKKQGRVKVTELAKVLNKRAIHAEIGHKLKIARKRARTLPKPLEKFHADQITRAAGYEHAKRQLNRWDAVVYQQKVAEQLQFPLKNETVKVHQETIDVSKLFRKPTELEITLAEMLKQPDPTNPQKEEESKIEEGEEEYPLTLAEVIEKRKMMAKLRAQQSYKQTKAARHSKIKSKKFHQIQRRARVKEQLKEFEELQKKDPEAALRKLEELERTRAEERVTLRHRSTGQWAKNLSVRAKYDKEARIALSEQLAKSRELTVKLAQDKDSESEKEEEERELNPEVKEDDPNNPWVVKPTKEMQDFVSGYRKFWESKEQQKENVERVTDTVVRLSSSPNEIDKNQDRVRSEIGKNEASQTVQNDKKAEKGEKQKMSSESSNDSMIPRKKNFDDKESSVNNQSESKNHLSCDGVRQLENLVCNDSIVYEKRESISKNLFNVSSSNLNEDNMTNDSSGKSVKNSLNKSNGCIGHADGMFEVSNICEKSVNRIRSKSMNSSFTVTTTPLSKGNVNTRKSVSLKKTPEGTSELNKKTGSWSVTKVAHSINSNCKTNKLEREGNKENSVQSPTGKFTVSESVNEKKTNKGEKISEKVKSIDELFEEVEDKLQDKIREKCDKLKEKLTAKRKNDVDSGVESDVEEIPSLELKKRKTTADIDEELLEQSSNINGSKVNENIEKTLVTATSETVKAPNDIDPNKFLKVTPRHLVTKLPDLATEGDDALDDEETTAEDRHLTISEAFAEDDVVDQFQKEKEEEAKKNVVGDVDLTLPGWGSWGGHNIKQSNRRKRKKFVIKFPKALPRRDTNRGNVIINEDADKPIKEHQVSDVPYPFTSVKEYEASIRAPMGSTWVPQTAYAKLTAPSLVTRMGAVITPMDDSQLVIKDKTNNALPSKNAKKNKNRAVENKT